MWALSRMICAGDACEALTSPAGETAGLDVDPTGAATIAGAGRRRVVRCRQPLAELGIDRRGPAVRRFERQPVLLGERLRIGIRARQEVRYAPDFVVYRQLGKRE